MKPSPADIHSAQIALNKIVINTPIIHDERMSHAKHVNVYLKAECLQRSGSFKLRGAYNRIRHLTASERERGVIAPSAGNHAQGLALAAKVFGVPATIVMPKFAPLTKVNNTKSHGANVVLHGNTFDDAKAHAHVLAEEQGLIHVPPFDDPDIIAGQGTIGLEVLSALPDCSAIVVPVGGGGLISGIAIAVKALKPSIRLIGVQATGCAPLRASLIKGTPITVANAQTIADGIAVGRPGDVTFAIMNELVDDVVEVTDDEIAHGIAHCVQHNRLVVEGAGATSIAAIMANKVLLRANDTVCAILAGGNIDGNLLSRVIEQVMVRDGRYMLIKVATVDRPGSLSPLIQLVAANGANIIDIFHRRALWLAPLGKVGIELVLEVRDRKHGDEVLRALLENGYAVERDNLETWAE
jgi:threonine dehydratase